MTPNTFNPALIPPRGILAAEKAIFGAVAAIVFVDFVLIAYRGIAVEWIGYLPGMLAGAGMISVGWYYRRFRAEPRIGLSFVSGGAFVLFTLAAQMLNYLMLPHRIPAVDETMIRIDAHFGYSWAGIVQWGAEHPGLSAFLGVVYPTSIPQVILVIIVLSTTLRNEALHRFMLTGIVSFLIATLVWYLLPTSGPSAVVPIDPKIAAAAHLIVGPEYGAKLRELGLSGPSYLSPLDALGLIGFPSYHLVLSLLAIWFTREFRWICSALLMLNVPMLPGILLHGGHHLVDLFGGLATFAVALMIANKIADLSATSRLERGVSSSSQQ